MIQPLVSLEVLQSFLAANKLKVDKTLGQNFLICEEVIDAILIGLQDGPKYITELGSGVGTLTQGLIGAGYQVMAIEKDDDFVTLLPSVVPPKLREQLTVVHGDLLEENWDWPTTSPSLPAGQAGLRGAQRQDYQLVGNIPYNLSGLIIRRLTQAQTTPHCAIFLMQKEVVERLIAEENNMSLLGLSVGLWGSAQLLLNVPSSCFMPAPAVQSALVMLQPNPNALPIAKREEIISKAKLFFQAKRKQIGTTLKRAYNKSSEDIALLCTTLQLSPTARPENVSVAHWIQLAELL